MSTISVSHDVAVFCITFLSSRIAVMLILSL